MQEHIKSEFSGLTLRQTTWGKRLFLLLCFLLRTVLRKIAQHVLGRVAHFSNHRGWAMRKMIFKSAAQPAGIAVFATALMIGLQAVSMTDSVPRIN